MSIPNNNVSGDKPNWLDEEISEANRQYQKHLSISKDTRPEELFLAMLALHTLMMHQFGKTQRQLSQSHVTKIDMQKDKVGENYEHRWSRSSWTAIQVGFTVGAVFLTGGAAGAMAIVGAVGAICAHGDKVSDSSLTGERMKLNHDLERLKSDYETIRDQQRRNVGHRDETLNRMNEAIRTLDQAKRTAVS